MRRNSFIALYPLPSAGRPIILESLDGSGCDPVEQAVLQIKFTPYTRAMARRSSRMRRNAFISLCLSRERGDKFLEAGGSYSGRNWGEQA